MTGDGANVCDERDVVFDVDFEACGDVSGNLRAGPTGWLDVVDLPSGQVMGTDRPPQETKKEAIKRHKPAALIPRLLNRPINGPIDKNRETPVLFTSLRLFIICVYS